MVNPPERPPRRIVDFYFEPGHQECVDARVFLEARGVLPFVIDIRHHSPPEAALAKALAKYGVKPCLNAKSDTYKAQGLAKKEMGADEALKLLLAHPELVARPFTIYGTQLAVGVDKPTLEKMAGRGAIGQIALS